MFKNEGKQDDDVNLESEEDWIHLVDFPSFW